MTYTGLTETFLVHSRQAPSLPSEQCKGGIFTQYLIFWTS